jgi:putative aminopeptidase FrvX
MISRRLQPDVAVCTDVCHDTKSPAYDKIKSGEQACGKGPVLTYGPAVQNNLLRQLIAVAQAKEIPFQRAATSRSTGTDTDSFAYSGVGVASALISLPLKYMHTTSEMVHKDDIQNVIKLMYEFLLNLQAGTDFRYIR